MNYTLIKKHDIADGVGIRVSLFVSGCTHHCKNCFNPETWDFNNGKPFDEKVIEEIIEDMKPDWIVGLTLLGGEPWEDANQRGLLPLLRRVKKEYPNKDIWSYSGYLYEDILKWSETQDYTKEMLSYIDVLVDGEFVDELKNPALYFRGSSNQRVIDVKKSLKKGKVVLHEKNI